jgi:hypothetical protein
MAPFGTRKGIAMPWIKNRFYANPLFGRALERARVANEGGVWTEEFPAAGEPTDFDEGPHSYSSVPHAQRESARAQHPKPLKKRHHGDNYDAATTQEGIANQVYNETSGLRPTVRGNNDKGSAWDLQHARIAMAHVIRNRVAGDTPGGLASPSITTHADLRDISKLGTPAYNAHGESVFAAHLSAGNPDPTRGAVYFNLQYGQSVPSHLAGKKPVATFGPFLNTNNEGDLPKGDRVWIQIYR